MAAIHRLTQLVYLVPVFIHLIIIMQISLIITRVLMAKGTALQSQLSTPSLPAVCLLVHRQWDSQVFLVLQIFVKVRQQKVPLTGFDMIIR